MDQETKDNITKTGLTLLTPLIVGGLAMLANRSLGCFIVGIGLVIAWSIVIWNGRFELLGRKPVQFAGYGVALVVFLVLLLFVLGRKPDVSTDASPAAVTITVPNSPGSSVVSSQGQSGGITAQDVDIVVNNYYGDKSPDERQTLHQKLLAKYPRGYAVFGVVDGKPARTIEGLSFENDCEIIWTGSEIAKFEPDYINFYPPQIIYKPTKNAVLGAFNLRLPRKIGFTTPYPYLPSWTNIFLEVLDDRRSFAVIVLGFREPAAPDHSLPSSGSQGAPTRATP